MIVYVETNFLFELGLGRAQRESCRQLLDWRHAGRIDLRIPTFAFPEMESALRKRETDRLGLIRSLEKQQTDAARHSSNSRAYEVAREELRLWTTQEGTRMRDLAQELLRAAVFLPFAFDELVDAYMLRYLKVIAGDADLVILSTVVRDLFRRKETGDVSPSMFITGDADFKGARDLLREYSCELLTSYSAAVARLIGQFE